METSNVQMPLFPAINFNGSLLVFETRKGNLCFNSPRLFPNPKVDVALQISAESVRPQVREINPLTYHSLFTWRAAFGWAENNQKAWQYNTVFQVFCENVGLAPLHDWFYDVLCFVFGGDVRFFSRVPYKFLCVGVWSGILKFAEIW